MYMYDDRICKLFSFLLFLPFFLACLLSFFLAFLLSFWLSLYAAAGCAEVQCSMINDERGRRSGKHGLSVPSILPHDLPPTDQ